MTEALKLFRGLEPFSFTQGENSPWPWVMQRPPGDHQDWYFFGYGHEYRQALNDYVKVAGRIPLPPRFAFGTWWSRYWAYSDQELDDLNQGFHENDTPLDVLVIDMDWHPTFGMNFFRLDPTGHAMGWSGYTWNQLLFPDPDLFLRSVHNEGLKVTLATGDALVGGEACRSLDDQLVPDVGRAKIHLYGL